MAIPVTRVRGNRQETSECPAARRAFVCEYCCGVVYAASVGCRHVLLNYAEFVSHATRHCAAMTEFQVSGFAFGPAIDHFVCNQPSRHSVNTTSHVQFCQYTPIDFASSKVGVTEYVQPRHSDFISGHAKYFLYGTGMKPSLTTRRDSDFLERFFCFFFSFLGRILVRARRHCVAHRPREFYINPWLAAFSRLP